MKYRTPYWIIILFLFICIGWYSYEYHINYNRTANQSMSTCGCGCFACTTVEKFTMITSKKLPSNASAQEKAAQFHVTSSTVSTNGITLYGYGPIQSTVQVFYPYPNANTPATTFTITNSQGNFSEKIPPLSQMKYPMKLRFVITEPASTQPGTSRAMHDILPSVNKANIIHYNYTVPSP